MMPRMNGYQVCRLLKSDQQTAGIPIVICTVRSLDSEKLYAYTSGADHYLTKPFDPPELVRLVRTILASPRGLPAAAQVGRRRAAPPDEHGQHPLRRQPAPRPPSDGVDDPPARGGRDGRDPAPRRGARHRAAEHRQRPGVLRRDDLSRRRARRARGAGGARGAARPRPGAPPGFRAGAGGEQGRHPRRRGAAPRHAGGVLRAHPRHDHHPGPDPVQGQPDRPAGRRERRARASTATSAISC